MLVGEFADPDVGYACGQARLIDQGGDEPGGDLLALELAVRGLESALAGVTAGNGAIYAVRSEAYLPLGPAASHDLSFPFMLTKRGWRAVYAPDAISEEKEVETVEGEFARKRRMMRGVCDEVVSDGMLSPRGYGPLYAFEIASHRVLRYASPLLHLIALVANAALLGTSALYVVTFALQLALLAAAALGRALSLRARCSSPATTCWSPPRSPPASGTGSGSARRGRGRRPRARGERGRCDLVARHASALVDRARRCWRVAAIAIKLDSRGPALYLARRVGRGGVEFDLYKLRTMHTGNDPVGVGTPVLAATPA